MLRIGDRDVYGAEVNTAAKLGEDMAKAGEILISKAVHQAATELAPPLEGIRFEPLADLPTWLEGAQRLVAER